MSSILVTLKVSPQHVEVDVSKLKGYEKHIIVELIKEKNLMSDATSRCNPKNCTGTLLLFSSKFLHRHRLTTYHAINGTCTAVIIYGADKLSIETMSYIKWMLEKFKGCNKVIFCCRDARKLEAIRPLCTYIKLLEPTLEEVILY